MVTTERAPLGSARLELVQGVRLLHPEDAVLDAMLNGWRNQQLGGRGLQEKTITERQRNVSSFVSYSNEYPWNWSSAAMDEWSTYMIAERRLSPSTIRSRQGAIRLFCEYITSSYYEWPQICLDRFNTYPIQICHEWNTTAHLVDYEGKPRRRPLTRGELQIFFDFADNQVDLSIKSGRKGSLAAYRDATLFKVMYGWGLRINEACQLDITDFYKNPEASELGNYGILHIRHGKRSRGSAPKRRSVASLMPWAVESTKDYLENIRPLFDTPNLTALWVTERNSRIKTRYVNDRFASYRDALGLDPALTPHCLRHSYITHLVEDGVDPKFVQEQAGHRFASTTGLYTAVSNDFMNTMLRQALSRADHNSEDSAK